MEGMSAHQFLEYEPTVRSFLDTKYTESEQKNRFIYNIIIVQFNSNLMFIMFYYLIKGFLNHWIQEKKETTWSNRTNGKGKHLQEGVFVNRYQSHTIAITLHPLSAVPLTCPYSVQPMAAKCFLR